MTDRPSKEQVLVIVLAETRAHEHTFDLFRTNLLEVLGADLCLCVADNDREDLGNPFYRHARYVWTYPEPEDWGDAFDQAQATMGYREDWRQLLGVQNQWLGGVHGAAAHPGSAGILLFFRWFLKHKLETEGVLERYDRFVVTRSDFVHRVPHVPLERLSRSSIWIPFCEDYGGYTDRHIVAGRQDIRRLLAVTEPMLQRPAELFSYMRRYADWNLEAFLRLSYLRSGLGPRIRRFPYTMYSVRSVEGHTRWAEGQYNHELGYCIKYAEEFRCFQRAQWLLSKRLISKSGHWDPLKFWLLLAWKALADVYKWRRRPWTWLRWLKWSVRLHHPDAEGFQ